MFAAFATARPNSESPSMSSERSTRVRLDAALAGLAVAFRGMTARPDETNCECHWGSADELALLKVPDVELEPDLLRRTWAATDWRDHASVLRRILPQLAEALVGGRADPREAAESFARGAWQTWPVEQARAIQEFLEAWWTDILGTPQPETRAYAVFEFCAVASGALDAWLEIWQASTGTVADRHLAEALTRWMPELLDDELPWDAPEKLADLTGWLVENAPARIADQALRDQVRLLGVSIPARWDDPRWAAGGR